MTTQQKSSAISEDKTKKKEEEKNKPSGGLKTTETTQSASTEEKSKKKDSGFTEKNFLVEQKEISPTKQELIFNLPAQDFEKYYQQALRELGKELKVDGFRQGTVPPEVAEKHLPPERVLTYAADLAIRKIYVDTVIKLNLPAVGRPEIDLEEISREKGLRFKATVELLPEVKLPDFSKEVEKINKKFTQEKVEVTEEEVAKELKVLAEQRVKLVTVNRPAKKGDQVLIDLQVLMNNVPLERGGGKKIPVILGSGRFIPGFEEQLEGMKAGEEKEFKLKFPQDYHDRQLTGKEATFRVKVQLVQERQLPEMNDEFAQGIGKFKSLAELKENIKKGLEHEKLHKKEDKWKKELIEALIKKVKIEIPQVLIDNEVEVMMREIVNDIAQLGLTKEQYFQHLKVSEEQMKKQWREKQAPDRVKAALILKQIAQDKKISPPKEKVEEMVNRVVQQQTALGQDPAKIDVQRIYEAVKGSLTNEEVFKWLMGKENVHQCEHKH